MRGKPSTVVAATTLGTKAGSGPLPAQAWRRPASKIKKPQLMVRIFLERHEKYFRTPFSYPRCLTEVPGRVLKGLRGLSLLSVNLADVRLPIESFTQEECESHLIATG